MGFDELGGLWDEGVRRYGELDPGDRAAVDRVIDEISRELTRRVGGIFTSKSVPLYSPLLMNGSQYFSTNSGSKY